MSDKEIKESMQPMNITVLPGESNAIWQEDEKFIELYKRVQDITIVSPHRCFFLYQFAKNANALEGEFAQVGVYKGGSAKIISALKSDDKQFYLFDTFSGLPEPDPDIDDFEEGMFSDTSKEEVEELFSNDESVEITACRFPEGSEIIEEKEFAFVYLDVDLYRSNYKALKFFYERMVPGGVIIFDDYGWPNCRGIKESIHDFLEETEAPERPIVTTKYQCVMIKS